MEKAMAWRSRTPALFLGVIESQSCLVLSRSGGSSADHQLPLLLWLRQCPGLGQARLCVLARAIDRGSS